jgi:hypothetical protein
VDGLLSERIILRIWTLKGLKGRLFCLWMGVDFGGASWKGLKPIYLEIDARHRTICSTATPWRSRGEGVQSLCPLPAHGDSPPVGPSIPVIRFAYLVPFS